MKKVFSKEKYIKDMRAIGFNEEKIKNVNNRSWVDNCEGLTREEMAKMCIGADDDWLIEVPDKEWLDYEKIKKENEELKKILEKISKTIQGHIDGFETINEYGGFNDILEVLYDLRDILKEVE